MEMYAAMMRSKAGVGEADVAAVAAGAVAIANVQTREAHPLHGTVRRSLATKSARSMRTRTSIVHSMLKAMPRQPTRTAGTMRIALAARIPRVGPPAMTSAHADGDAGAVVAAAADARVKPQSVRPRSGRARAMRPTSTTSRCP